MRYYQMSHDISLVKLNAPVMFNDGVQPACLPYIGWYVKPGWTCYVTGWGETRGKSNSFRRKSFMKIVNRKRFYKC